MSARIIVADVLEGLASLPPESVQCVVTSPPYWGLRDYGVPGQLGLEPTPRDYLIAMRRVFRAVRRVLRKDGVAWVNMGDCYATGAGRVGDHPGGGEQGARWKGEPRISRRRDGAAVCPPDALRSAANTVDPKARHGMGPLTQPNRMPIPGLKPKDLVGMPWRLALALQRDGWWLRSDVVWSKPNPMPESVTDRPTRSHEYLFQLTKRARYFYDADAIAEPLATDYNGDGRHPIPPAGGAQPFPDGWARGNGSHRAVDHSRRDRKYGNRSDERKVNALPEHAGPRRMADSRDAAREAGGDHDSPFGATRNKRSVWTIATEPYPEAHFATFPTALVEPCILAGTSAHGACSICGTPWRRLTARTFEPQGDVTLERGVKGAPGQKPADASNGWDGTPRGTVSTSTLGWRPGCECGAPVRPCLVLDPFAGSGTTGLVADRLGRDFVGIELSPVYAELARRRLEGDSPLFAMVNVSPVGVPVSAECVNGEPEAIAPN